MTREHKLALIIGFTLILIVGVLISDHLSGQRELKLASVAVDDERATLGLGDAINPLLKWAEENARDVVPAVQTAPVQSEPRQVEPVLVGADTELTPQVPEANESAPIVIRQGRSEVDTSDNLGDAIRRVGGSVEQQPDGSHVLTLKPGPEASTPGTDLPANGAKVDPKDVKIYRIQEKDSLYSIAKATYGDASLWRALAEFNEGRVGKDGAVRVNATIKLPPKHVLTGGAPGPELKSSNPSPATETAARKPTEAKPVAKGTTHKVVKGDSLAKLAEKHLGSKDRAREILAANRDKISDPNQIQIGMVLKIPPR